jgi:CubicO group peptidase (beta-lactamase class C family)
MISSARAWCVCAAVALASCIAQAQPEAPPWADDFDAFFARELEARHIPGAVFVVVADGAVVFQRGYGVADLAAKLPVEPDQTLFRVASVSKLFTATAAMQLVEAGKLDLQSDINTWLGDAPIADEGFGPITLHHLLTHTPGFDDRYIGMSTLDPARQLPLEDSITALRPQRIVPPGRFIIYSNYGYSTAGYLVERLSGMPFHAYVDTHILEPLGMSRSGFRLQEAHTPNLATGYVYRGGDYEIMPYDYSNNYPAGAFMTTGADMARFLQAHLQGGSYQGNAILRPETAALMHETHFTHGDGLNGWCYGFEEDSVRGVRLITHGGSTSGFTSHTAISLQHGAGYFFSCNHEATFGQANAITRPLADLFAEKVLEVPDYTPETMPEGATYIHDAAVAGTYRVMRYSRSSLAKVAAMIDGRNASFTPDGSLHFGNETFTAAGNNLFVRPGSVERVMFIPSAGGAPAAIAIGTLAYEKTPVWDTPLVQQSLAGIFLLLLIAPQIVAALLRWRRAGSASLRLGWGMLAGVGLLLPVFFAFVGYELTTMVPYAIFWGPSPVLRAALALPLIALALTLCAAAWLARHWRANDGHSAERTIYLASVLGATGLFLFLYHWNLLGYRLG